ncbi:MAG: sodium/proline symporter PutP [Pseudomonadales bacterium]
MAADGLLINFIVYVAAVFAIGIYAAKRTHNVSDYLLGGRSLGPKVAALSAGASDMSGWLLIGLPGFAYVSGVEAFWLAGGLCIGVALAWGLVARRLRLYSYALDDAVTIPIYLQRRFADSSPWLRIVSASFILLFFLFYVCSGLVGSGKLFASVFGWDYQVAVVVGATVVVSYTLIGGFLAVSWTDVLQAILMTIALVIVPYVVISGSADFSGSLSDVNPELLDPFTNNKGEPLGWIAWASSVGWGLAYFGQPHILARFKAMKDPAMIPFAAGFGVSWSVLVYVFAVLAGMSGVTYLAEPLVDSEQVFMVLIESIFHPAVAGFLLAAILAAIMSTVDSQLLVSSAALAEDLYGLRRAGDLPTQSSLRLGRSAVVVMAIVAAIIALDPDSSVLGIVGYAWGGLGSSLGPAVLLSLYWPRMTKQGALAGVLVGGLTVLIWGSLSGGIFELYELVPGFFFSLSAIVIVSLLTPVPEQRVTAEFKKILLQTD